MCRLFLADRTGRLVTMTVRTIRIEPARYSGIGTFIPEHEITKRVPICIGCWLQSIRNGAEQDMGRGRLLYGGDVHFGEQCRIASVERFRCEGCGRPMRVFARRPGIAGFIEARERVVLTASVA
jgi:hypothetical protein